MRGTGDDAMLIWVLFAGMTAVAALTVLVPLMRGDAATTAGDDVAAGEVSVYRDQLAEVDRDLEAGLIAPAEAEAARAEIGRRILRLSRATPVSPAGASRRRARIAAIATIVAVPLIGLGVYLRLGHPDRPDAPLAERRAAAPSLEDMVARVEAHLVQNPGDVRGWEVLAPVYVRLGRLDAAADAWRKAIEVGGPTSQRLDALGETLFELASGTVSPEAEAAFRKSLEIAPNGVLPRMYLALALSQQGKPKESADAWRALIASAEGAEPWLATARKELAKVDPSATEAVAPPAAPGPSAGDVEAAARMSPEERAKMIDTMVGRLEQRLAASGGTIDEWERLIRAQKMLGRLDAAEASLAKARAALSGDAAAAVRLDALTTGLSP